MALPPTRGDDSCFRSRELRTEPVRHSNARIHFSNKLTFSPRGCRETQKWRSHPPCRSFFFVRGALGARRIFEFYNPSRVRMRFLHMLVVNVLLASRFFTSGIDLQLAEYALAISNSKPRTILTVFAHTRFHNTMSLPPTPQQHFFAFATIVLARK